MQAKPERITHAHRTCRRDARASPDGNPRSTFDGGMTMDDRERLTSILDTMDVPDMRRDLNKRANVRWLLRNVAVRNFNNAGLREAMTLLKSEAKRK